MSKYVSLVLFTLISVSSFAQEVSESIRAEADLDIQTAKYEFITAQNVKVELYSDEKTAELTSMILSWEEIDYDINKINYFKEKLIVSKILTKSDVLYIVGSLPQVSLRRNSQINNKRFSVVIKDFSNIPFYVDHIWEVTIRKGETWCGTTDSTMNLTGNPTLYKTQPKETLI